MSDKHTQPVFVSNIPMMVKGFNAIAGPLPKGCVALFLAFDKEENLRQWEGKDSEENDN